ncbi:glycosyltransferase family 4 protein [Shimia ponticola]|uniref:glycosyltransferase family 4 protein n=1 Tax=Shimia ponticola TaxID=2582893 RepID=UPI0011BF7B6A|nr:glycosyltransferase family 1 protein [Shimia ponticola]
MHKTKIFMRSQHSKQWSIERVFQDVLYGLPKDADVTLAYAPFRSRGVIRRLAITLWAAFAATKVNHISGDIHFIAMGLPRRRTILTIHDVERLDRVKGIRNWLYTLIWFRWPIARAKVVTTISQRSKDDVVARLGCPASKVHVIYNPLSPAFTPAERPFDAQNPRILHIGTRPNKNLERVIPALEGLPCTLVIIGPLSEAQRRLLDQHSIRFENAVDLSHAEIVAQYQNSDIVLFPSLFEGFGLVAIEGQACGKPVVTSRERPFDEVVGTTACLVDPTETASIRAGVVRVMEDAAYREELVRQGFENAKRFAPETIAAQYLALYRAVATGEV